MRAALLSALLLLAAAGCGDNKAATPSEDAAPLPIDAPLAVDAAVDAPPGVLGPCLDRPTDLPRPPTGQLPCDMLPPGFAP